MKTRFNIFAASAFVITLILSGCYKDNEEDLKVGRNPTDTSKVTFEATIRPLFISNCGMIGCHSGTAPAKNISLDSYQGVINAKILRIRGSVYQQPGFIPMPSGGSKLSANKLNQIDTWINDGMLNN